MTTISPSSAGAPPVSMPRQGSPEQRILDRISAQQQAGSLGDTDATALASAVQDIGQALSGQALSGKAGAGAPGGSRLDPSQAKGRMDDLIAAEVDKGTLTGDQASALKSLMSSHEGRGHDGPRGEPRDGSRGGPEAAGGPPPADSAATGSAAAASGAASDVLSGFLKRLQDAQGPAQGSGYGAGGGTAAPASQAAVFDFQV